MQVEEEATQDLINEGKSRDLTIESLIQRNKFLSNENEKLKTKCFEAAKLINELGIDTAKLKDRNRVIAAENTSLKEKQIVLEDFNLVYSSDNLNLAQSLDQLQVNYNHLRV